MRSSDQQSSTLIPHDVRICSYCADRLLLQVELTNFLPAVLIKVMLTNLTKRWCDAAAGVTRLFIGVIMEEYLQGSTVTSRISIVPAVVIVMMECSLSTEGRAT